MDKNDIGVKLLLFMHLMHVRVLRMPFFWMDPIAH